MTAPSMSVDMRHTKLSAEDAALIAGEIVKPSWASRNEGIHERISFDDTLWGFELAGGSFYKTPLRVVYVKPGGRADQACIRKGDTVLKINGYDTSTLTLQEAHDMVLESGIHLKISVTSPEDEEDAYYTYEDPLVEESRIADELRKAMEAERIRRALARAQRSCNLPWPWVRRKIIIYRESNCFLVPSKYENKHKEHFPDLPHVRYTDDICEFNKGTPILKKTKENGHRANSEETEKGEHVTDNEDEFDNLSSVMDEREQNKIINEILEEENEDEDIKAPSDIEETSHSDIDETNHGNVNGEVLGPDTEEDGIEHITEEKEKIKEPEKEDRLEADITESKILEENNDSPPKTEINDTETNDEVEFFNESSDNVDKKVENEAGNIVHEVKNVEDEVENFENVEENFEDDVKTIAPTSDFVNEDDGINKSDEDNVVDGIVGDFNDSTNER